jgi:hypothetical protein
MQITPLSKDDVDDFLKKLNRFKSCFLPHYKSYAAYVVQWLGLKRLMME